jgi:hypothetical protein
MRCVLVKGMDGVWLVQGQIRLILKSLSVL